MSPIDYLRRNAREAKRKHLLELARNLQWQADNTLDALERMPLTHRYARDHMESFAFRSLMSAADKRITAESL